MSRLEEEFCELVHQWKEETGPLSLVSQKAAYLTYQKIIAMGWPVVPLIIRELEHQPNNWFWALREITGENPVKPEHQGQIRKMAQDWIEWWNKKCNN